MPIATPEAYAEMLDRAKARSFAYPAINVTSSQTLNAAIRGFADAESDGIVQVSTGGAEYLSGPGVKDMVTRRRGARRLRARGRRRSTRSTSRCTPTTARRTSSTATSGRCSRSAQERVDAGRAPLFQSHMWDGSAVPLDGEPRDRRELLDRAPGANVVLEIEIGVVGGEEDGVADEINEKLYTTPGGRPRDGRGARARRERPLPAGGDVRQRARRLQAGQRQAAPGDPQGDPGRGRRQVRPRASRSTSSSTAAPARCRRRSARRSTTASSR